MIRFGEETEDEVFVTQPAAIRGVQIENTGSEPLVGLRYFGPNVHRNLPKVGDYLRRSVSKRKCWSTTLLGSRTQWIPKSWYGEK